MTTPLRTGHSALPGSGQRRIVRSHAGIRSPVSARGRQLVTPLSGWILGTHTEKAPSDLFTVGVFSTDGAERFTGCQSMGGDYHVIWFGHSRAV